MRTISTRFRGGYFSYEARFIHRLPIHHIDPTNATDKQSHDAIVAKVEEMLGLQAQLAPIRHTPTSQRDDLLREVEHVDRQIDNLVYDLYGLTQEERRLVAEA